MYRCYVCVKPNALTFLRVSSADRHQHRPDVLRGAPGTGRAQRRHRRLPDGAEIVAHERLVHQSQRLHLLQQESGGRQRKLHQRGVTYHSVAEL